MYKRLWSVVLAAVLLMSLIGGAAAEAGDQIVVTVNGQELRYAEIEAVAASYSNDPSDEAAIEAVWQAATDACIDSILLDQDMQQLGMFDDMDEDAIAVAGQQAYEAMVLQYTSAFMESTGLTDAEQAISYVEEFLNAYGYTVAYYEEYYRQLTVVDRYMTYLMQDKPSITDAEINAAYEKRVAQSQALYANDVEAFELALTNNQEAWYVPEGYRAVLQIYLSAQGESAEKRQAAVQDKVDEIYARLEQGEAFTALMAEFNEDADLDDPELRSIGYQVHRESVMWADTFVHAVFAEEMKAPGDVSSPVVSDGGVHILYYLSDRPGGPVELTDELKEALRESIYAEKVNAAMDARLTELKASAVIIYTEN